VVRNKRLLWHATGTVQLRSARLAEVEALHAQTPVEEIPPDYYQRVDAVRRELDKAKARRQFTGQRYRSAIRARGARQSRLSSLNRQLRPAIARRESAEGGLGAYIVRLTSLAALRAENQSSVELSATGTAFAWPSIGRISQTYGCTGFHFNPPRGSCRHFHDGLDIVSGYGSRVSAAADGVVAYAGWNPWDEEGRAWIMVISHPDGYVTRYGHLIPTSIVRVGEFVRQGQGIGRMGSTGYSTGTHLHFELLAGGTAVSPWAYLPAGMVRVTDNNRSGKHGGKSMRGQGKAARRKANAACRARADAADALAASRAILPSIIGLPPGVSLRSGVGVGEPARAGQSTGRPRASADSPRQRRHGTAARGRHGTAATGRHGTAATGRDGGASRARHIRASKAGDGAASRRATGRRGCADAAPVAQSVADQALHPGRLVDGGQAGSTSRRAPDVVVATAGQDEGVPLSFRGTSPRPQ
jgi:murein DD-endopeptidase MepM/ murein hydrolase activator NlpD